MTHPDTVIVGGGIIGVATALRLQALGQRVLLLEKEAEVGVHQTGHNSGVIHAGVYYAPGSLKARFCAQGVAATRAFCTDHGLPFQTCGKLIVATDDAELPRLAALETRARANGIAIERLTGDEARRLEPNIASVAALLSPSTGIVDYGAMTRAMADLFRARGGDLRCGQHVIGGGETRGGVEVTTAQGTVQAGHAVICAGLQADRMARAFGADPAFRIIPFRGDYFEIRNQPADLVRHLIYPVPDPERPFLGVHLTRKLDGRFTVGPSAVLAASREGYGKTDVSLRDLGDALGYVGFWRLLARNARSATDELAASLFRSRYLRKVQRYCPRITGADLAPYNSGVRAQAVGRDGRLIDDFLFIRTQHALHVCNAPSPAATSALPIADHIAATLLA